MSTPPPCIHWNTFRRIIRDLVMSCLASRVSVLGNILWKIFLDETGIEPGPLGWQQSVLPITPLSPLDKRASRQTSVKRPHNTHKTAPSCLETTMVWEGAHFDTKPMRFTRYGFFSPWLPIPSGITYFIICRVLTLLQVFGAYFYL